MNENELIVKEKAQETTAVAPVSEKTITNYLETFGMLKNMPKNLQGQCVEVAKAFQLNPFKREVHFVQHRDKNGDPTVAIVVGYEVYIKRAQRTGLLDGWDCTAEGSGPNMVAILTIYRKDWSRPFKHSVKRSEYDRGIGNWKVMPETMLKKVAISQGFRLCFPEELGGMPYTKEEQWEPEVIQETMRDVTPAPAPEAPQKAPEATVTDPRDIPTAPTKRKATPEEIEKMAALARSFKPDELEYYKEEYNGDPAGMIEAMEKARIAKFEAGTLNQEPREERQHPWATPEQREALEKLAKETPPAETGEEKIPALYFEDDSKELYEK